MKEKISVTIDEVNFFKIRDSMRNGKGRSQAVEFFLGNLLRELQDESEDLRFNR